MGVVSPLKGVERILVSIKKARLVASGGRGDAELSLPLFRTECHHQNLALPQGRSR